VGVADRRRILNLATSSAYWILEHCANIVNVLICKNGNAWAKRLFFTQERDLTSTTRSFPFE
jgi:hypothetical protein